MCDSRPGISGPDAVRKLNVPALDAAVLTTIATACRDREQLRFDYTSQDGTSSYRIVEPYRLARARSHWYLYGWDTDRRDWRTFRADRITLFQAAFSLGLETASDLLQ